MKSALLSIVTAVLLALVAPLHAAGMAGLGFLPGGAASMAYGTSADGSVVVGFGSTSGEHEAFRWTPETAAK